MREALERESGVTSISTSESSLSATVASITESNLDVLLLDASRDAHAELDALERSGRTNGKLQTILAIDHEAPDVLLRALRLGVREVVKVATLEQDLAEAMRRVRRNTQEGGERRAKILSFFPCKGGAGSTFLATNFAYALSSNSELRVLLIDLNLQFGDAHMYVSDRKSLVSVSDIAREIQRLDLAFLRSTMIDILPNFGLLPAPEDPTHAREFRPAHLDTLLGVARDDFDYIILDLGRTLDTVTVRAFDQSDFVLPVMQLTLPFLREARRLLQLLKSLDYPPSKVRLLVNRYEKGGQLTTENVSQSLGMSPFALIPNHFSVVSDSINQGIPIAKLHRGSPVTKAIGALSEEFHKKAPATSGWLSKMLKR